MIKKLGYVAVLDIRGFSERVARDSELGGLDRYIDTVLAVSTPYHGLRVILFSNTVVLRVARSAAGERQRYPHADRAPGLGDRTLADAPWSGGGCRD